MLTRFQLTFQPAMNGSTAEDDAVAEAKATPTTPKVKGKEVSKTTEAKTVEKDVEISKNNGDRHHSPAPATRASKRTRANSVTLPSTSQEKEGEEKEEDAKEDDEEEVVIVGEKNVSAPSSSSVGRNANYNRGQGPPQRQHQNAMMRARAAPVRRDNYAMQAWSWMPGRKSVDDITDGDVRQVYRLFAPIHTPGSEDNCKKNCKFNPLCYVGRCRLYFFTCYLNVILLQGCSFYIQIFIF